MTHLIRYLSAAAAVIGLGLSAALAQTGDFDPAEMRCLDFVNGQGESATNKGRADIARIWIMGYSAGHSTGKDRLEWVDDVDAEDKIVSAMVSRCREYPEFQLSTIAEAVASDRKRDVPATLSNDFNPQTYMCGDYADGREGSAADVLKADIADVWAFAFVQGYVASKDSEMLIPVENKPAITGAIASNCAKNREFSYFDLTSAVAPMVTPQ